MKVKVAPVITKYWADDAFPFELLPAFRELGIGGLGMQGYVCRGGGVRLGEHNDEILRELGFAAQEIAGLRAGGVVPTPKHETKVS